MRRLAVLALAACGGSKPAPGPALAPAPDAVPEDPAVTQLEIHAERACACTDDGCRQAAADALHALDDTRFPKTEQVRAAQYQLARCLGWTLHRDADEAVTILHGFRDRACACSFDACATDVADEAVAWIEAGGARTLVLTALPAVADALGALARCVAGDGHRLP